MPLAYQSAIKEDPKGFFMGTMGHSTVRIEDPQYFQGAQIREMNYKLPCPACGKDVYWVYTPTGVKDILCDC